MGARRSYFILEFYSAGAKKKRVMATSVNPFPANSCSMKQLRRMYNFPRSEKGFHQLKRLFEMLSVSAFWLDSEILNC